MGGLSMKQVEIYRPTHPVRYVSASSVFDGHDASINIMRRILQSSGAEVMNLGHNRSAEEDVDAASQEDAQGIAISSSQSGHEEYFKYMVDYMSVFGAGHIKVYGGGGGTILPREIKELHDYGVAWIFSPEDGRKYGLQGMINKIMEQADFKTPVDLEKDMQQLYKGDRQAMARLVTYVEDDETDENEKQQLLDELQKHNTDTPVLGMTGTGGAGK